MMRILLLVVLLLFASQTCMAQNTVVEFDEAQINKSTKTDSAWNFMDVNLNLTGDGLKEIKWYYGPVYTKAETESGNLLKKENDWTNNRLWRLKEMEENFNNKCRLWQRFNAPAKQDQKLVIEGYAEVYVGSGADDFIEIDDYLAHSKEIIKNPIFKIHKIDFSYLTRDDMIELKKGEDEKVNKPGKDAEAIGKAFAESFAQLFKNMFGAGDSDLTFVIKSEDDPVLNIVLINDKGETLETASRSISQDEETGVLRYGIKYKRMLPFKGKIRVYVDNGKNVKKIPFKYQVALP